jgi:hypothetical protein
MERERERGEREETDLFHGNLVKGVKAVFNTVSHNALLVRAHADLLKGS